MLRTVALAYMAAANPMGTTAAGATIANLTLLHPLLQLLRQTSCVLHHHHLTRSTVQLVLLTMLFRYLTMTRSVVNWTYALYPSCARQAGEAVTTWFAPTVNGQTDDPERAVSGWDGFMTLKSTVQPETRTSSMELLDV